MVKGKGQIHIKIMNFIKGEISKIEEKRNRRRIEGGRWEDMGRERGLQRDLENER